MSESKPDDKSTTVASYVGFGIVVILLVAAITYLTASQKDPIQNNVASEERMKSLPDTFTSTFGPNWPIIFMIFAVLFLIFAALIYMISKNGINFVISDVHFNTYKWIGITLIALVSIVIIAGVVLIVLSMNADPDADDPDEQARKNHQIVGIIVIVAGLVALGGLVAWYNYSHRKRQKVLKSLKKSK